MSHFVLFYMNFVRRKCEIMLKHKADKQFSKEKTAEILSQCQNCFPPENLSFRAEELHDNLYKIRYYYLECNIVEFRKKYQMGNMGSVLICV